MEVRRRRCAGLALFAWIASVPTLSGWSPEGHRIVALAAQKHLSENAKRRVTYLLGENVGISDVATWADEIVAERPETEAWHSITIPPGAERVDLARDCPLGDCITSRIRDCVGIVRLAIRPRSEIVDSFKMLVSLVADMHQPMLNGYPPAHSKAASLVELEGNEMPLVEAWESGLIRQLGSEEEVLERVRQRISEAETERWMSGTYRDWTWETHRVAVDNVYPTIRNADEITVLQGETLAQASEVLVDQLAKSAIRLAYVLDVTWP